MIPEPPRRPLESPGDILEGTIDQAAEETDRWGNQVLHLTVKDDRGRVHKLTAGRRLWRALKDAAGNADRPAVRITRLPDLPAVGSMNPAKNWEVQLMQPRTAIPDMPAKQTPQRQGPSW